MSEPTTASRSGGLCATCVNAPSCSLAPRDLALATWYCEEYSHGGPRAAPADLPPQPQAAAPARAAAPAPRGLCSNCLQLPTCRLPKAPGGVWHCGEYL